MSRRSGWNVSAPPEYALPTETWRELIARRQHYREMLGKMVSSGVSEVNDLITLNLDIERFAKDVISQSEGPELLWAFWKAVNSVSVLDPTCGSGAFLFAALNILEPLYTACLEGMHGFVDDIERSQQAHNTDTLDDFRTVLEQVDKHPNQRYFILKSIILNNLYGVDIMEEVVEICKLRLFLKMVAQLERYEHIEPLPDIDFNIRAGNTLVGFTSLDKVQKAMQALPGGQSRFVTDEDTTALARINEAAKNVSQVFDQFRSQQTVPNGTLVQKSKTDLRSQIDTLRDELDRYLAAEYDVDSKKPNKYNDWRNSHRPFHWFVEFYGIMNKGGFDVVVGNPPYVEYSKIRKEYTLKNYQTGRCGNLYAMMIERSYTCLRQGGRFGMIVPISYSCTDRMKLVQQLCLSRSGLWLSHFDGRPAKLFEGIGHNRATIVLSANDSSIIGKINSTAHNRWYTESRSYLFDTIKFSTLPTITEITQATLPKIGSTLALSILKNITKQKPIHSFLVSPNKNTVYYHNAPLYWIRATDFVPYFWSEKNGERISDHVKTLNFASTEDAQVVVALLNSTLFYWWFLLLSNCRDLTVREINNFPLDLNKITKNKRNKLIKATKKLMVSFKKNSHRHTRNQKTTGRVIYDEFHQKPSKPIVDEIDQIFACHYGLSNKELDFVVNYSIKYRLG